MNDFIEKNIGVMMLLIVLKRAFTNTLNERMNEMLRSARSARRARVYTHLAPASRTLMASGSSACGQHVRRASSSSCHAIATSSDTMSFSARARARDGRRGE